MNLKQIIVSEKKTGRKSYVLGTKIEAGSVLNGKELNFKIANALRGLTQGEISFSKAIVYIDDLGENYNGFLYTKGKKQIFIIWNADKKRISEMVFSQRVSTFEDEEILQAIILLESIDDSVSGKDAYTDVTGFRLGSKLPSLLTRDVIMKGTSEATLLADAVSHLEEAIANETIRIYQTSDDEFEVKKEEVFYFEDILDGSYYDKKEAEAEENVEETIEPQVDEEVEEETSLMDIEEENEVAVTQESEMEQISLFDEPVVKVNKKVTTLDKVQKGSKNKEREQRKTSVKKNLEPVITMDTVKKLRPDVYDDKKARAKLQLVNADKAIIDFVMGFRKSQRETLSPELLLDVPEKQNYVGSPIPIEQALAGFLTGCHMLIQGVTSTGKTTMTKTVLNLLNLPMYFAGGSQDASIETFVGFKTLEDGSIAVKNAPLLKAMKNGGAFYLDEGNAVMESVLILMHSTIDDERTIYNEMTGEQVYAHPNFRFVTTINPGYAGTNEMNLATNDRLVSIEMGHLRDKDLEYLLNTYDGGYSEFQKEVIKMGEVSKSDIFILTEISKRLQTAVEADEFSISPEAASTRNIIQLLRLTRVLPFHKAIKMIIAKYPREDRPAIEAALKPIGVLNITASSIYHS